MAASLLPADSFLYRKTIHGHEIAFTDYGFCHDGPAIITFSGWNSDHRGYSYLTSYLMQHYRVINICFRSHGPNRDFTGDFGFEDHARDTISLLDSLGVTSFICLAASHGNWAAMDLAEMVGRKRMLALIILDHLTLEASPQFYGALKALQDKQTWRPTTVAFFKSWLGDNVNENIKEQLLKTVGGFGYETWALSGKTVELAYKTWGTPLNRLEHLKEPPLVHHIYSQPKTDDYRDLHEEFQKKHPEWFTFVQASGQTHFPHIEDPEFVYRETFVVVDRALKKSP